MTTCVFAFVAQYFFVACASITAETGSILQTKSSFSVRADHDGLGASEQVTNDDTKSVGNDDAAASSLSTAEGEAPSLAMVDLSQHWVHGQDGTLSTDGKYCLDWTSRTGHAVYMSLCNPDRFPHHKWTMSADGHLTQSGAGNLALDWTSRVNADGSHDVYMNKKSSYLPHQIWHLDRSLTANGGDGLCLDTLAGDAKMRPCDGKATAAPTTAAPTTAAPTTAAPTTAAPTTAAPTTTAGVKWDVIVKAWKLVNFDKDLQVMKGRAPSSATYVSDRVASVAPPLKVEGYYFFKLTFKGSCDKDTTMNCRRTVTMHWAQTSWLFESEPSGFHGIEITDSDGPVRWGKFNGLRSCGKLAVFCSTTGWWAAVGQYQIGNWKSGQQLEDGIPAWPVNKFSADTVELQVRVP